MENKVRIGIVGAGKISEVLHIPNTLNSPYAELVAIADTNDKRMEYIKGKLIHQKIRFYKDYRDMIQKEDIDAIIVAVPNVFHAEVAIYALENDKNVLVEKPMAANSQEALEMINTARKKQKILMVNHSQRFFPHHQKAREIILSGLLGEIRLVKTMFGHSGPEVWSQNASWFFDRKLSIFGALGDLGVHKIDLIRYITGLEIVECVAFTATLEKAGTVEDIASAVLRLSNSGLATLDSNWVTKGLEENYIVVYGEKGTMKVGQIDPSRIDVYLEKPVRMHADIVLKPLFTNEDPYWKLPIVDHFAKVCLGLEEPLVKPEDGYIAIKVIEKILESTQKKQVVSVEA